MQELRTLRAGLSAIGLTTPRVDRLAEHAGLAADPAGMLARVAQMRWGVDAGVISSDEACTILEETPQFLQRSFHTLFVCDLVSNP